MTAVAAEPSGLRWGEVVRGALEPFRTRPWLTVVAGAVGLLAGTCNGFANYVVEAEPSSLAHWLGFGALLLASLTLSSLLAGLVATLRVANAQGRGDAVPLGFAAALRCLPALLVFDLFYILALLAGLAVLVVPGLIIATAWAAGGPALVAENLSPWRAIIRSAELTKGHRWHVFGVLLVAAAVLALTGFAVQSSIAALTGREVAGLFYATVLGPLNGLIYDAPMAVLTAAIYVELRRLNMDLDAGSVSEVFS
jgi:hypothetical protein